MNDNSAAKWLRKLQSKSSLSIILNADKSGGFVDMYYW